LSSFNADIIQVLLPIWHILFFLSKFNDLQRLRVRHTSAHWCMVGTFTRNTMYLVDLLPLVNWNVLSALVPCIAKATMINCSIVIILHYLLKHYKYNYKIIFLFLILIVILSWKHYTLQIAWQLDHFHCVNTSFYPSSMHNLATP